MQETEALQAGAALGSARAVGDPDGQDEGDSKPDRSHADLERLYRSEFAAIAHAAFVMCGSSHRAAELAQEAFLIAFTAWPRVSALDRPGAWVRRVAINLAITARKREARTPAVDPVDFELVARQARDQEVVERHQVRDAIASLPTNQQLAIVLTYIHDLPTAEVAAAIGCAEATVRVHLHRARATLGRQLLAAEESP